MRSQLSDLIAIANSQSQATCIECQRVFNLWDEDDAGEWFYGHDCEVDES